MGYRAGMSRLHNLRREAEAYLAELDAERDRVRTFLTGLQAVLDAEPAAATVRASTFDTNTTTDTARATVVRTRTGGDAAHALQLMTARADVEEWDTPALLAAMQAGGWTTDARSPENSVSAILSRLARAGQLERRRRGRYAVPRSTNAESPAVDAAGLSVVTIHDSSEGGDADGTGDHRDHDPSQGHRDHAGGAPAVGGAFF